MHTVIVIFFFFKLVFTDAEKYLNTLSSSDSFPAIVGGTLGACVIVIIGVVLALFVTRYALCKDFRFICFEKRRVLKASII